MNYLKSARGDALMMIVGLVAVVALAAAGTLIYQRHQDATTTQTDDTAGLSTDINQANNLSVDEPVPADTGN